MDNRVVIAAHTIGTELVNKHKSKLEIGGHLNNLVWRAMVLKVHKLDDPEHIKSFAQLSFLIIKNLIPYNQEPTIIS